MITLVVSSTLLGALLATRFKVFVLFPAMLTIVTLNIFASSQGSGLWHTLFASVLSITGLQLGFFISCLVTMTGHQPFELESKIANAEGSTDLGHGELEAARAKLDGMVAELQAISKQVPEQSAVMNPRTAHRAAAAASR